MRKGGFGAQSRRSVAISATLSRNTGPSWSARPAPAVRPTEDATRGKKRLSRGRIQAIFALEGTPLGECRTSGEPQMKLTREMWAAQSASAQRKSDEDIAAAFRERNAAEVAHLSDDALLAAIREAREVAVHLGISTSILRMRFIMLGVFRLPGFWKNEVIWKALTANTGTPDMRFGDVCALLKLGAHREEKANYVWW